MATRSRRQHTSYSMSSLRSMQLDEQTCNAQHMNKGGFENAAKMHRVILMGDKHAGRKRAREH